MTAAGNFLEWQRTTTTFQSLAAWTGTSINLATSSRPERIQARAATPGWLTMVGHRFLLGRDFLPEEGQVGKDHEAILTNNYGRVASVGTVKSSAVKFK